MSYTRLIEKLWHTGGRTPGSDFSMEYAFDMFEHPDFDMPGVLAVSSTGRVLLVVEGKKEDVGPIIEKAVEIGEKVGSA